jgi:ABC-type transport system involved in multi-copper enzyme maturation permease subunit
MPVGKWTFDNPVIAKELRGRMRGPRAYWMLLFYLLLLSIATLISYYAWWRTHSSSLEFGGAAGSFTAGREFYMVLFVVQACLIALISPALTSGAISIEREQRTLEMLQCTTLKPRSLVAGKLVASLSYVVLLLTSSIPLISICFLLGGVSPEEVGGAYLMLICDAFFFGSVALCWSVYAANTVTSVIFSYLTLIVFFVLSLPSAIAGMSSGASQHWMSSLNPVGALSASGTEAWYALHAPSWLLAVLVNGGLALLACWLGVHRLEDEGSRRTLGLRCYVFALIAGLLIIVDGGILGMLTNGNGDRAAFLAFAGVSALLLFLPTLVTGDYRDFDQHSGAPPRRWLTFDLRDAFRTASLRSVFPTAVVTGVVASSASMIAWAIWLKSAPTGMQQIAHQPVFPVAMIAPILALTISTCVFVAAMGLFLSLLLRNRWGALCLTYVAIFLVMAAPAISYAGLSTEDAARMAHDPGIYLMYLTPITDALDFTEMQTSSAHMDVGAYLPLYGSGFVWVITSIAYLLLAAALTAISRRIYSRRAAGETVAAAKAEARSQAEKAAKTNAAA